MVVAKDIYFHTVTKIRVKQIIKKEKLTVWTWFYASVVDFDRLCGQYTDESFTKKI